MLGVLKNRFGYKFSIFSHFATNIKIRLFECGNKHPFSEKKLERLGDIWSITIKDLPETFEYTYRCSGPYDPKQGHLFNDEMDLLDPYAKLLSDSLNWSDRTTVTRGLVKPDIPFEWGKDARPMIPVEELIIYEMHLKGFTNHRSSGVKEPGSFKGMIEKIPYLKELGINAIELLPIHMFNDKENLKINPKTEEQLFNYWGYSTSNFFTLMKKYGSPEEFKMLIKELHLSNIEVILDVVYNHTSEGSCSDYYYSFRGIDNASYYMVNKDGYLNYSGCGNTFNCNHPIVIQLILDSLRYFVTEYHIDGFRFDLASILTRGLDGQPIENPPLIDKITRDPILGPTKLIAEPWDPGGLYQVGSFPSWKFGEWNDKFRDHVRQFIRGDGNKDQMKYRILGSYDIYPSSYKSYNYITIHDGFSMRDLVSYNQKYNESNGEENQDGTSENISWNCGIEGPTDNTVISTLREQQIRNFFVILLMSQGVPMILMGDEYGHTKKGNNNTWCQDNELNYFLWDELEKNRDLFNFVSKLIHIRKSHLKSNPKIQWFELENESFLAYMMEEKLLIAFNPSPNTLNWNLPKKKWKRLIDTSFSLKEDIINDQTYSFIPYSSVVLIAT